MPYSGFAFCNSTVRGYIQFGEQQCLQAGIITGLVHRCVCLSIRPEQTEWLDIQIMPFATPGREAPLRDVRRPMKTLTQSSLRRVHLAREDTQLQSGRD